ncbi:MAG: hypothetical protein NC337_16055, partial [Roseburia sp.]|nr:hypothetical protein [Roseburia sp.]
IPQSLENRGKLNQLVDKSVILNIRRINLETPMDGALQGMSCRSIGSGKRFPSWFIIGKRRIL